MRALKALRDEEGMTTAELLGNAALGVAALVIWVVLQQIGLDVMDFIRSSLGFKTAVFGRGDPTSRPFSAQREDAEVEV
jgi:hypothetical protein